MWLSITETRSYMDWFFVAKFQIMRLISTGIWRHLTWLALVAGELAIDTVFKTPTNMCIFHVISSMTYDVIKKRIGNFLSGWTLNKSQKNLCWVQLFQRLRSYRLQPFVLPGAPVPIHYCGTNTLGRPKQLVMLGVSSTKQVDS